MNRLSPFFVVLLLAGCNAEPEATSPAATAPAATEPSPAPASAPTPPTPPATGEAKRASAKGVVQSIDATDKSITIAHGPVDALGWPGMTMAFQAPDADLAALKAGDSVTFEFDSTGMDGTIVSIKKQ